VTKLIPTTTIASSKTSVPGTEKSNKMNQVKEVESSSETDISTAWKDNTLAFQDETLEDISIKMERWFGIPLKIQDEELKKERFTGNFMNQESVYQVLDIINRSEPIQYTKQNKTIIISRKRHN
jgi:transmembrane sensor